MERRGPISRVKISSVPVKPPDLSASHIERFLAIAGQLPQVRGNIRAENAVVAELANLNVGEVLARSIADDEIDAQNLKSLIEFVMRNGHIRDQQDCTDKFFYIMMHHCFAARASEDKHSSSGKLSLDELKTKLDTYANDESKTAQEKTARKNMIIGRGTEASFVETLLLSQLRKYRNIFDGINPKKNGGEKLLEQKSRAGVFSLECLYDSIRTRRFIQAIRQRVSDIEKKKPDLKQINVIDAGSGSIPIMGIYAALCSPKVKVTCLENDAISCLIARQLVEDLGLSDQIEIKLADATQYQPSEKPEDIHLVVSETMNRAFYNEQMTQIMNHLKTYTNDSTYFIPEQINLSLVFKASPSLVQRVGGSVVDNSKDASHTERMFEASKPLGEVWQYRPGCTDRVRLAWKAEQADLKNIIGNGGYFGIKTSVDLTDKIRLAPNESNITATHLIPIRFDRGAFLPSHRGKPNVWFEYEPGSFKTTFCNSHTQQRI